jgi:hypothetical protein
MQAMCHVATTRLTPERQGASQCAVTALAQQRKEQFLESDHNLTSVAEMIAFAVAWLLRNALDRSLHGFRPDQTMPR